MSAPLVVIDADVLGRHRTGDETYVEKLLRALPAVGDGLRFAAVTRHPELVPDGVEPIDSGTSSQELRMAVRMPWLLRRVRPALAHFLHALPPSVPCPRSSPCRTSRSRRPARSWAAANDGSSSRRGAPRRSAARDAVLTISERTKDDIVAAYGMPAAKVVVTPLAVDPASRPARGRSGEYLLVVGVDRARGRTRCRRATPPERLGKPLVVAGPDVDEALARRAACSAARTCAATSRRRSSRALPRRAACCSSRPGTKASAPRRSRRWPAGRRSSPRPIRLCSRSAARGPLRRRDELGGRRRDDPRRPRELRPAPGSPARRAYSWERDRAPDDADVYRV